MKKRVLINLRLLQQPYTGVQSYVYNLVRSWVKQSKCFEFHILVTGYQGNNTFVNDLLSYDNVFLVDAPGFRNSLFGVFFDIFLVNKFIKNYDIYFSPVNILPLFKIRPVKHVVGVLDLCTFIVPETTTFQLKTYYDIYLKTSLERADLIITISNSTKNDLLKLFNVKESVVKVVHLGVDRDLKSIGASRAETEAVLDSLGLSHDSKFFLTIGTSKRKNVERSMEAFSRLSEEFPELKLVVVVNNREMQSLILRATRTFGLDGTKVIMTGRYISPIELKILYSRAMGLVYCPHYEGFGLPILEAMQNKCPVVASNNSSLAEISADAAILVNENNPEDIASGMKSLLNDDSLRVSLIKKGVANAEKYTWKRSSEEFDKLFQSLI